MDRCVLVCRSTYVLVHVHINLHGGVQTHGGGERTEAAAETRVGAILVPVAHKRLRAVRVLAHRARRARHRKV